MDTTVGEIDQVHDTTEMPSSDPAEDAEITKLESEHLEDANIAEDGNARAINTDETDQDVVGNVGHGNGSTGEDGPAAMSGEKVRNS